MNSDTEFYFSIGMNEIPWNRLVSFYGRADAYPSYFLDLLSPDEYKRKEAITKISRQTVHQDTISMVTPFALIFLLRLLSINDTDKTGILQVILKITKAAKFQSEIFHKGNLEINGIKDLLLDKYIWKSFENKQQDEINLEEFDDTDIYFYWVKYSIEIVHTFSFLLKRLTEKNEIDIVNEIFSN